MAGKKAKKAAVEKPKPAVQQPVQAPVEASKPVPEVKPVPEAKPVQKTASEAKPEPKSEEKPAEKKGIDDNLAMLLAYVFTLLGGAVVFFMLSKDAKDQKLVRFHAMQAMLLGVVQFVLCVVFIGFLLAPLIWLYALYVGFVYAYKGMKYKIPYIGEYAEKYAEEQAPK